MSWDELQTNGRAEAAVGWVKWKAPANTKLAETKHPNHSCSFASHTQNLQVHAFWRSYQEKLRDPSLYNSLAKNRTTFMIYDRLTDQRQDPNLTDSPARI